MAVILRCQFGQYLDGSCLCVQVKSMSTNCMKVSINWTSISTDHVNLLCLQVPSDNVSNFNGKDQKKNLQCNFLLTDDFL